MQILKTKFQNFTMSNDGNQQQQNKMKQSETDQQPLSPYAVDQSDQSTCGKSTSHAAHHPDVTPSNNYNNRQQPLSPFTIETEKAETDPSQTGTITTDNTSPSPSSTSDDASTDNETSDDSTNVNIWTYLTTPFTEIGNQIRSFYDTYAQISNYYNPYKFYYYKSRNDNNKAKTERDHNRKKDKLNSLIKNPPQARTDSVNSISDDNINKLGLQQLDRAIDHVKAVNTISLLNSDQSSLSRWFKINFTSGYSQTTNKLYNDIGHLQQTNQNLTGSQPTASPLKLADITTEYQQGINHSKEQDDARLAAIDKHKPARLELHRDYLQAKNSVDYFNDSKNTIPYNSFNDLLAHGQLAVKKWAIQTGYKLNSAAIQEKLVHKLTPNKNFLSNWPKTKTGFGYLTVPFHLVGSLCYRAILKTTIAFADYLFVKLLPVLCYDLAYRQFVRPVINLFSQETESFDQQYVELKARLNAIEAIIDDNDKQNRSGNGQNSLQRQLQSALANAKETDQQIHQQIHHQLSDSPDALYNHELKKQNLLRQLDKIQGIVTQHYYSKANEDHDIIGVDDPLIQLLDKNWLAQGMTALKTQTSSTSESTEYTSTESYNPNEELAQARLVNTFHSIEKEKTKPVNSYYEAALKSSNIATGDYDADMAEAVHNFNLTLSQAHETRQKIDKQLGNDLHQLLDQKLSPHIDRVIKDQLQNIAGGLDSDERFLSDIKSDIEAVYDQDKRVRSDDLYKLIHQVQKKLEHAGEQQKPRLDKAKRHLTQLAKALRDSENRPYLRDKRLQSITDAQTLQNHIRAEERRILNRCRQSGTISASQRQVKQTLIDAGYDKQTANQFHYTLNRVIQKAAKSKYASKICQQLGQRADDPQAPGENYERLIHTINTEYQNICQQFNLDEQESINDIHKLLRTVKPEYLAQWLKAQYAIEHSTDIDHNDDQQFSAWSKELKDLIPTTNDKHTNDIDQQNEHYRSVNELQELINLHNSNLEAKQQLSAIEKDINLLRAHAGNGDINEFMTDYQSLLIRLARGPLAANTKTLRMHGKPFNRLNKRYGLSNARFVNIKNKDKHNVQTDRHLDLQKLCAAGGHNDSYFIVDEDEEKGADTSGRDRYNRLTSHKYWLQHDIDQKLGKDAHGENNELSQYFDRQLDHLGQYLTSLGNDSDNNPFKARIHQALSNANQQSANLDKLSVLNRELNNIHRAITDRYTNISAQCTDDIGRILSNIENIYALKVHLPEQKAGQNIESLTNDLTQISPYQGYKAIKHKQWADKLKERIRYVASFEWLSVTIGESSIALALGKALLLKSATLFAIVFSITGTPALTLTILTCYAGCIFWGGLLSNSRLLDSKLEKVFNFLLVKKGYARDDETGEQRSTLLKIAGCLSPAIVTIPAIGMGLLSLAAVSVITGIAPFALLVGTITGTAVFGLFYVGYMLMLSTDIFSKITNLFGQFFSFQHDQTMNSDYLSKTTGLFLTAGKLAKAIAMTVVVAAFASMVYLGAAGYYFIVKGKVAYDFGIDQSHSANAALDFVTNAIASITALFGITPFFAEGTLQTANNMTSSWQKLKDASYYTVKAAALVLFAPVYFPAVLLISAWASIKQGLSTIGHDISGKGYDEVQYHTNLSTKAGKQLKAIEQLDNEFNNYTLDELENELIRIEQNKGTRKLFNSQKAYDHWHNLYNKLENRQNADEHSAGQKERIKTLLQRMEKQWQIQHRTMAARYHKTVQDNEDRDQTNNILGSIWNSSSQGAGAFDKGQYKGLSVGVGSGAQNMDAILQTAQSDPVGNTGTGIRARCSSYITAAVNHLNSYRAIQSITNTISSISSYVGPLTQSESSTKGAPHVDEQQIALLAKNSQNMFDELRELKQSADKFAGIGQ